MSATDDNSKSGETDNPAVTGGHAQLFYEKLERVDPARHGDVALSGAPKVFDFAGSTNSVPLNAIEFVAAARHYPILFNGDARGMPLALVGSRSHENLFVEADGQWAEGCYVPAFVRRYPFLLLSQSDSDEIALCIDSASSMIEAGGERRLFEDGEPSDVLRNVAQFCATYSREQNRAQAFAEALRETAILVERAADINLPDGQKVAMRGFNVVDMEKFHALPADIVLDWWDRGWVGAIYAHTVSLGNFGRLYLRAGGAREIPDRASGSGTNRYSHSRD
jgi:hypothetical protein